MSALRDFRAAVNLLLSDPQAVVWARGLMVSVVAAMVVSTAVVTIGLGIGLGEKRASGIVFPGHATQGLMLLFAVAVALAGVVRPDLAKSNLWRGNRFVMASAMGLLIIDIVFVLPTRSGYVSLLVIGGAVVALLVPGRAIVRIAAAAAAVAAPAVDGWSHDRACGCRCAFPTARQPRLDGVCRGAPHDRYRGCPAGAGVAAVLLGLTATRPATRSRGNMAVDEVAHVDVGTASSS